MSLQIVMDSTGDTRHEFDRTDLASLAQAEQRFRDLIFKGYTAIALTRPGTNGELMRTFDPTVEKTVFIPRLQGG